MKYLVMETHPAYAVLLDEEGRWLKAANLRYQVGDTVQDIVALRAPQERRGRLGKPLAGLAAMAACLCLIFFGYYQPNYTAYGTLRIQINPDVEMTISRTQRVLALEGLNQDGMDLIEGYAYQGKRRDAATDELVDRAIEMGYLSGGDTISITVRSRDTDWQAAEEDQVRRALEDRYGEQVVIRIGGAEDGGRPADRPDQEDDLKVVIPVAPQTPPPGPVSGSPPPPAGTNRPYDDTDYGPGGFDYDDTDYGPYGDGVTDYEDRGGGDNDGDGIDDDDDNDDDDDGDDDDNDDDNDGDDNDDG